MAVCPHERVKWWRERLALTQEELGVRCGLHQTKISRIETGEQALTVDDLEVIVRDGFRTSMVEFYRARAA